MLDQIDALERHEADAAEGIVHQCAVPLMVRRRVKAAPPPPSPSPAAQKPQHRSPREPAPLDLTAIKRGYVSSWDSRGACGVAELAGGGGKVVIAVSATLAGGITNPMVDQAVEFKIVLGRDGRMEVETGSLKIARNHAGIAPAELSGWDFARKRYSVAR